MKIVGQYLILIVTIFNFHVFPHSFLIGWVLRKQVHVKQGLRFEN